MSLNDTDNYYNGKAESNTVAEPLTEEEKEAKRFATWKSDSNKILLVIDKVLPLMNKLNSYGEDSSDVEVKAKLKKKLFDKTFKKIKEGLKKINRNLRKNIKLQVVKLKEFKEQTALNNYGEKYKAKLTEKFRSKLKRKYKHLFKVFEKNLIDLDFYNSSTGLGSLMSLGMATQFAILKTADPRVGKLSADFIKNAMLLQSKLKACKKCYGKPYFALTFELLVPENNHCKKYLYGSKLLISREYDSTDEYSNSVRYTCTTKGITIYAYIGSISDSEVLALKKGALYSLHGELYHVDYEANQSSSADKIILRFNLKSLKSIQKIE